jgi:hypothetical protein
MTAPWREESWSKGILLGLRPDPNTGYRATVWFEYTRYLFNEVREGSLIAVRNFSDRRRNPDGSPAEGGRNASYEEYSILQIDQVHPWHYAIQGGGEQGYPGFTVAAAESARTDWTDMDAENRDDVSRIKCEAIPLRLAFRTEQGSNELPEAHYDRSMPMPGFEARLLSPSMMRAVLNKGIDERQAFELGRHIVQYDVPIEVQRGELIRLHFGIFGYTGAGKSNLVSSLVDNLLAGNRQPLSQGVQAFKVVLVDLMDEYTGLLIDHLLRQRFSQLVVCGRRALPEVVLRACIEAAEGSDQAEQLAREAAEDWSGRLILPSELKPLSEQFREPLSRLILDRKIVFYEPRQQQGIDFDLEAQSLDDPRVIGPAAYRGSSEERDQRVTSLINDITPLIESARETEGVERDTFLNDVIERLQEELENVTTVQARRGIEQFIRQVREQTQTRGVLPDNVSTNPWKVSSLLNYQPHHQGQFFYPSLTVVIGENEESIAVFVRQLVDRLFNQRRTESILYPTISFIFDEADVFISQARGQTPGDANLVEHATMLARRGRKFGLGLGIATQRVRFLDTSIMAQPHTYFISKLPRKSDRDVVAEAFAISDETLEQTFSFTVGQWLVTSHDATGLKGVPFPVQLPNANDRVRGWLESGGVNQIPRLQRRPRQRGTTDPRQVSLF